MTPIPAATRGRANDPETFIRKLEKLGYIPQNAHELPSIGR